MSARPKSRDKADTVDDHVRLLPQRTYSLESSSPASSSASSRFSRSPSPSPSPYPYSFSASASRFSSIPLSSPQPTPRPSHVPFQFPRQTYPTPPPPDDWDRDENSAFRGRSFSVESLQTSSNKAVAAKRRGHRVSASDPTASLPQTTAPASRHKHSPSVPVTAPPPPPSRGRSTTVSGIPRRRSFSKSLMAIFSSSKKKKGDNAPLSASQQSVGGPPPSPDRNAQLANSGSFSRSQSGGIASPPPTQHGQLQQSQPPSSFPSGPAPSQQQQQQQQSGAPQQSHTILYPWAQRPVQLAPSSLLPPSPDSNSTFVNGPISAPPFPRYGHSVNPTASLPNGDLYIFGGLVANNVKNDLYVLSCPPAQNGALSVGAVETRGEVPGPRVGHASVGVGNVLIVWGGDTKSRPEERQDDSLYLLNLSTREWTRVKTTGPAPEGRYGHAAAMVGSRFFVLGGQKDDGGFMNDLAWFDLQKLKAGTPKWSFADYGPNAIAPPKRTGHTAVTHADCIYIFGGTDGQYHYNDTWCYDTNTGLWSELSCIGYIPVPREGHAATLVDDVMYVFGGRGVDGKDLEDLAAFKITNQRWFMFQNMGPAPSGRSGHAMATWMNKVYVLGGESYTSTRADDPSFVHVLDTSKIKYPPDSGRAPQGNSRKSSIPVLSGSTSPPPPSVSSPPQPGSGLPPPVAPNSTPPMASGQFDSPQNSPQSEDPRRAASPTNRGVVSSQNGEQPKSFGQVINEGQQQPKGKPIVIGQQQQAQPQGVVGGGAKNNQAKRATTTGGTTSPTPSGGPPVRPARPGDEEARRVNSGYEVADRAMSPSQRSQRAMSPSGAGGAGVNGSPPLVSASTFAGGGPGVASAIRNARSPSPNQGRSVESAEQQDQQQRSTPPQDAFYYGSRSATNGNVSSPAPGVSSEALKAKEEEIAALKSREKWMATTLALAVKKGFVAPEVEEEGGLEGLHASVGEGENKQVLEALITVKQELAKAKTTLAEQAQAVDDKVALATRGKTAALQEASYYRAKLAALEAGSAGDATKLERERSAELERKLTEALASKAMLEHQVEKLQGDIEHHTEMRASIEERHSAATNRAEAAESSYSRSLTDYADLQRRSQAHETAAQEHVEKIASLTSSLQVLQAEHSQLKERSDTSENTINQHVRAIEESQLALAAAHARNDEIHSVWQQSQTELTEHRTKAAQLQSELESRQLETSAAVAKAADLERILKATKDEHDATKLLATGGLAELVAAHRDAPSRDVSSELNQERLRAVEDENLSIKQLHQDSRAKVEATLAELNEARSRESALQAQVVQLKSEMASLRGQHAQILDDASRHKSTLLDRDGELKNAHRTREAAEVKVGLLRSIMADHGLSVTDDDLATRFPPLSGDETPEQLHRRVQELETRLEQRNRAHQELESAHEDSRRELADSEQRHREAKEQLEGLRATGPEESARATKAQEDLEALQGRHQQLEQTHLRAIQYVKGTEKMLRRMKEELTRYKERNEELEAEVGDRGAHADLKTELETVRAQLAVHQTTSSKENGELQARLASLQADFDHHQSDADAKIHELETELTGLDQDLEKARHELDETLVLNNSLNNELRQALKNSSSTHVGSSEDTKRLEQELAAAQTKSDWLKRENAQLEKRCEVAEQKISILLDAYEETGTNGFDGSPHFESEFARDRTGSMSDDASSDFSAADRFKLPLSNAPLPSHR